MRIDGREIAKKILEDLKIKVQKLSVVPHLAIILVGNDPASKAYVNQKKIKAEQIGAKTTIINLESGIPASQRGEQNSELNELINKLNFDNTIHGIIVQRPLSSHINSREISLAIHPKKDVDGFHSNSEFESPIFMAVLALLNYIKVNPQEKNIAIFGKGETGGKPIINSFKKMGINPIIIDSKTKNPKNLTRNADIIISAVGKPQVIKSAMIKKGVILISIGLHKGPDDKLHGDYEEEEIKNKALFYSPTPGGVGPINVAMLLKNLLTACENFSR